MAMCLRQMKATTAMSETTQIEPSAKCPITFWKSFWIAIGMIFFGLPLIDLYANFWLKPLVFFLFRFWDKYGW